MTETWTDGSSDASSLPDFKSLGTWWDRYSVFGLSKLSRESQKSIEDDCRFIEEQCVVSPSSSECWAESRIRRGIVVGAIQSGKTASMLGLSALLLDSHVDVLVILAGRQISLWKQTLERFMADLDGSALRDDKNSLFYRAQERCLIPDPVAIDNDFDNRLDPKSYLNEEKDSFRDLANAGFEKKVVIVIPKVVSHLRSLSKFLENELGPLDSNNRKYHMVVMDDEADDGSILDANDEKTIPRNVEQLWTGKGSRETFQENLYATYVAYTATPHANFLQQDQNPLAPVDFSAVLRTPGEGPPKDELSYKVSGGISHYYHGGDLFYGRDSTNHFRLAEHQNLPAPPVRKAKDDLLLRGLRSYLVSGAIRHQVSAQAGKMALSEAYAGFDPSELDLLPDPHCMLIHPSMRKDQHQEEVRRLILLSRGVDPDGEEAPVDLSEESWTLCIEGLKQDLKDNPEKWFQCLDSYRQSLTQMGVNGVRGLSSLLPIPEQSAWTELENIIFEEIVPRVAIRVINSDVDSSERPEFKKCSVRDDSKLDPPADLLTIFVSGNVLARGITIEGLTSTVITRSSAEVADTQMQMQRWYGYRGKAIHLCRLFCFTDLYQNFKKYHHDDVLLRKELIAKPSEGNTSSPLIHIGRASWATAKVPQSRLPLSPGATPSVKLLESGNSSEAENNAKILGDLLGEGSWENVVVNDTLRGVIADIPLSLKEVAELLDRFQYQSHLPDPESEEAYKRWSSQEKQQGIERGSGHFPLYRGGGGRTDYKEAVVGVSECPYSIAAYLRLWSAACESGFSGVGLYEEGRGDNVGDWTFRQHDPPRLYVAVRYGMAGASNWEFLNINGNPVQAMKRGRVERHPDQVQTLWGSSPAQGGPANQYYGDQLLDYHHNKKDPTSFMFDSPMWRPKGEDGLIVFHVIRHESEDSSMKDGVTVGLSLPHGGPEQFSATR